MMFARQGGEHQTGKSTSPDEIAEINYTVVLHVREDNIARGLKRAREILQSVRFFTLPE